MGLIDSLNDGSSTDDGYTSFAAAERDAFGSSDGYDTSDAPSGDDEDDGGGLSVTSTAGGGRGGRFDDTSAGEVVTEDEDGDAVAVTGDALDTMIDPFRSDETREGDVVATDDANVSDVVDSAVGEGDPNEYVEQATEEIPDGVPNPEDLLGEMDLAEMLPTELLEQLAARRASIADRLPGGSLTTKIALAGLAGVASLVAIGAEGD